jgi:molybdopterin-containing oxidoreductase family iron-sulfur binding subunit
MDMCPTKSREHTDAPVETSTPARGKQYWRSMEELAGTKQFEEFVQREFPNNASEWLDPLTRRNFLRVMGASIAFAGLQGCTRQPEEEIVPYVLPPEQAVPGKPMYFATAMPMAGYGVGVLAESHLGRPTKIEGNPDHPASLGATDIFAQASILTMWDPDRAQVVRHGGEISTWSGFFVAIEAQLKQKQASGGAGLRILTETVTSPTLIAQMQSLLSRYPRAKWHHWEPINADNAAAGAQQAFGRRVQTVYRFDNADRVVSLDADFLCQAASGVRYAHDFAIRRRVRRAGAKGTHGAGAEQRPMSRFYAIESTPTNTGAAADHRLSLPASEIENAARALLQRLQSPGNAATTSADSPIERFLSALAADLAEHRGRSIIIAGDHQPPAVHAMAFAMNGLLGNIGQTVLCIEPIEPHSDTSAQSLAQLAADMSSGAVDTLIILGGNPVYTAPADLDFAAAMEKVALRIHHSLYFDETSFLSHWHVPETHYLESWSDVRAFDGTASLVQPLIAPLYQGRSVHELLAAMLGDRSLNGREIVRNYWRQRMGDGDFDTRWRDALQKGVIADTASAPVQVTANVAAVASTAPSSTQQAAGGMELIFRADPHLFDGRFANNGWLQELPRPLTKLTWDNVALMSAATAKNLGVVNGDVVRLKLQGREVDGPVWIVPGHPQNSVTVHLGYGRERAGAVGTKTPESGGFNAYLLRTAGTMHFARGLVVEKTGRTYPLACTQPHQMIDELGEREIIHVKTLAELDEDHPSGGHEQHAPAEAGHHKKVHLSLYPEFEYEGHKWGMSIDMTTCLGCQACVVACQSENNIPVVGKEEVNRQREMHWLRIDTYYEGSPDDPTGPHFQPMLCQHCEKAPCEVVCPVAATTHSSEGINEMTYNRCVGTRYCSNNCPYKVRRFNFFQYSKVVPALELMYNPDVTVRERGVMEKCTYCVQRVNGTRIEIKKLSADYADTPQAAEDERQYKQAVDQQLEQLQTACQQACPTQAIVFGDLNHKTVDGRPSRVAQLKAEPHDFGVLTELTTQPRTTYLARIMNPNPALQG